MPSYMLLLYEGPAASVEMSPEEMQQVIQKYRAWGDRLRNENQYIDSQKLTDGEGRVLKPASPDVRVTDGPYSETKEVIGGYYTVAARSYDEAVQIAKGCPQLEFGGTIEIRQIHELD